jgi:hypothetical protein
MPLPWVDIQKRALAFSKKWKDATDESLEAQNFLNDFFNVLGIDRKRVGTFETRVPVDSESSSYNALIAPTIIYYFLGNNSSLLTFIVYSIQQL